MCRRSSSPAPRSRSTTCSPSRAAALASRSIPRRSRRWRAPARSSTARSPAAPRPTASRPGSAAARCSTSRPTGHDRLLVRQHRISQGAPVAHEVVRAHGAPARERPRAGDDGGPPRARIPSRRRRSTTTGCREIRTLGSIGQSDLAQMADLADGILGDFELVPGEAIALLNQSAFATALRCARVRRCARAPRRLRPRRRARPRGARRQPELRAPRDRRRRGRTPGCRRRSPASARCSRAARSRRATSRIRSRSGRSRSRTAPPATRSGSSGSQLAIELNAAQSNPLVARRRGQGHLGRQLRDAAARDRARRRAARARARDLHGGRAGREAPAAAR